MMKHMLILMESEYPTNYMYHHEMGKAYITLEEMEANTNHMLALKFKYPSEQMYRQMRKDYRTVEEREAAVMQVYAFLDPQILFDTETVSWFLQFDTPKFFKFFLSEGITLMKNKDIIRVFEKSGLTPNSTIEDDMFKSTLLSLSVLNFDFFRHLLSLQPYLFDEIESHFKSRSYKTSLMYAIVKNCALECFTILMRHVEERYGSDAVYVE